MREDTKLKKRMNDISFTWQFAIDDFKMKYAGSILGGAWAFLQPIITILLYWFVFQLGFRSQPVENFPFILWLVTGLVPWFFVNEAVISATVSLVEYSYLVKKVLFNIKILPLVKILSTFFVQIALVVFTIILFIIFGYYPQLDYIRIFIYLIYMFLLAAGLGYLSATIYVFFRDTIQIVNIIFQILFWTTPIVWDFQIMPEAIRNILIYNPLYYIINGYRRIFIFQDQNIQSIGMVVYYWCAAILLFAAGRILFNKCKDHFPDVL